jgi:hypothetical protein
VDLEYRESFLRGDQVDPPEISGAMSGDDSMSEKETRRERRGGETVKSGSDLSLSLLPVSLFPVVGLSSLSLPKLEPESLRAAKLHTVASSSF